MYVGWTDERIEKLKALWANGTSASGIARELGGFGHCMDGGRSAVIGKVHRLKLAERSKNVTRLNRINANRFSGQKAALAGHRARGHKVKPPKPLEPIRSLFELPTEPLPPVDTMPAQVSHNKLMTHHCRAITVEHMPFNADKPMYCGERKVPGQSYCAEHCRRYFAPPKVQAGTSVPGKHLGGLIGRVIGSEIGAMKTAEEFLKA